MTDLKTIVITWTERRAWLPVWEYGHPKACLWLAEGTDADLNAALTYAHNAGGDYRVHTFATDDPNWKTKALRFHPPLARYAA